MKIVTSGEMREIERQVEESGTPIEELIRLAGLAVVETVEDQAAQGPVVILAGPGNNGSDGLEAARILSEAGRDIKVLGFKRTGGRGYEGKFLELRSEDDLGQLRSELGQSGVVVDGLLGTGQSRPLEGLLRSIIEITNEQTPAGAVRIAVDVPTGVNADNGAVPNVAFRADLTVSMGFAKRGEVVYPGAEFVGSLKVAEVGIPRELAGAIKASAPDSNDIAKLLPKRGAVSNKGAAGRVVFIGGSQDFVGAPALAGIGAYRVGAGLVEMIVPETIQPMVAAHAEEVIYQRTKTRDGQLSVDSIAEIDQGLERARAAIYGPGLGLSEGTIELTKTAIQRFSKAKTPAVIDADGLNGLAQLPGWSSCEGLFVLTPHPGEMSRLTGLSIDEIQADRIEVGLRYASQWNQVVVLKGAGTVVAAPDGRASVNRTGGSNLATAGTGDVLSGMIGGLLAQGIEPFAAAVAATYWHGRTGDILRREQGNIGTIAGDLLPLIPFARLSILEEAKATS